MNKIILKIVCIVLALQSNLFQAMEVGIQSGVKFPLHTAIMQGDTEIVRRLVQQNSPVDLLDDNGQLPLQLALKNAHSGKRTAIMSTLIEAGASVDHINVKKEPLLFYAIRKVDVPGVRLLLAYGASLSATDLEGRTPLEYAKDKVKKSDNKKTELIVTLVQDYVNGREPEYRKNVVGIEERAKKIAQSQKSVLKALTVARKELEEKIALRERENYFLEIDRQALQLQYEIKTLKANL